MSQAAQFLSSPPTGAGRAGIWPVMTPVAVALSLGLATVGVVLLSNGSLIASVAPVLGAALLWGMWLAPLRVTLGLVMFLGLAADRPGDAEGQWVSPIAGLGGFLFQNLNKTVDIEPLKLSGVSALLLYLLVVRLARVVNGRSRDTAGSLVPAAPMLWSFGVATVAVFGAIAFGTMRGGDIQMAKIQVQAFLQMLAAAYLFSVSLRGPHDYRWLARLIVAAACVKAIMAVWVRATLPPLFADSFGVWHELEYATSHGDSIVFACATAALVGPLFHQPTRRQLAGFLLLMPLIVAGVVANDRRIAWVQIALVVVAFLWMNPRSAVTRGLTRIAVLSSPLLLVYAVVGWQSASRVFGPVSFVRNIVQAERTDGSLDRSTLFRDVENFNLVHTFRKSPIFGTGFGHPFEEEVAGDDLSTFKEYFYLPHNSLVGLWSFSGVAGFTGIFSSIVVGLFLSARAHPRAQTSGQAIAIAAAIGCLWSYLVNLWADIGFTEASTIFLVGLALAVASQMATATGAWPERWERRPGTRLGNSEQEIAQWT